MAKSFERVLAPHVERFAAAGLRFQAEISAPSGVPDFVLFRRRGRDVTYVVIFELKLRNWRRALQQAFKDRNVANESYVVMSEDGVAAALANLDRFNIANVGLLSFDDDQVLRSHHLPTPTLPFSTQFSHEFGRALIRPKRRLPTTELAFTRTMRGGYVLRPLRRLAIPTEGRLAIA